MVNCVPRLTPTTLRSRMIYFLWLFFCLNWTTAYTSSLITMITTALRGDDEVHVVYFTCNSMHCSIIYFQVRTIEDVLDLGIAIGGDSATYRYFKYENNLDEATKIIKDRFELCQPLHDCLAKAATNRYVNAITISQPL